MIDLKGHAALVTGSSKGVGRAIAIAFAKAGADVIIHGREKGADADEAMSVCRGCGVKVDFITGDLSGPTEPAVTDVFNAGLAANAKTDILVNNAGQFFDVAFEQMTLERFEKTMRLNVYAPYFLTQHFVNHWIKSGTNGRVLMIGSINGRLAEPGSTAYDTSKGALEMMVKTLAANLAAKNVRVNGMAPGLVKTPRTAWIDSRPKQAQWIAHHTPNKQIPGADVCGGAAVYLCSDDAWHVHGQMLLVDGGMSIWQHPSPM